MERWGVGREEEMERMRKRIERGGERDKNEGLSQKVKERKREKGDETTRQK